MDKRRARPLSLTAWLPVPASCDLDLEQIILPLWACSSFVTLGLILYLVALLWRLNVFIYVKHALPGMKYMLCKWRQVELFSCLPDSLSLQNWAVQGLAPGRCPWTNERFPFSFSHPCRASLPATVLHLHQWARVLVLPASPADAAGPVCVHLWDRLLPRPPLLCR